MKKVTAFVLFLIIILSLSACGSSAPQATSVPAAASEESLPSVAATASDAESSFPTETSVPFAEEHQFQFDLEEHLAANCEAVVSFAGEASQQPVWQGALSDITEFSIDCSEPDAEGFVTYTIRYSSTPYFYFEEWPADGTNYEIHHFANAILPLDYYSVEYLVGEDPDWDVKEYQSPDYETVLSDGTTVRCNQSGTLGDWIGGLKDSSYMVWADRTDTMTVRAPQEYDGLVLGLNELETFHLSGERPEFWHNDNSQYNYWHFLRVTDYLAQQGA